MRSLGAAALLLGACSSGGLPPGPVADGGLQQQHDLAAPPPFCPGTRVAGTCAEGFFRGVAACWMPTGSCQQQTSNTTAPKACWSSGAELAAVFDQASMQVNATWSQGELSCMVGVIAPTSSGATQFKLGAGGVTLLYDDGTGDVTCPDGTHANIGPHGSDCPTVSAMLNPQVSNCPMGTCP